MTTFHMTALAMTGLGILIVVVRFRKSSLVLIGGLVVVGLYTSYALATGAATFDALGLGAHPWLETLGFSVTWAGLMFAYSPVADRLATRWTKEPPNLEKFRALQESRIKLIVGILVAWILGGILEELVFRGIVLNTLARRLTLGLNEPIADACALCLAAFGAGLVHLYQGFRAVIIVMQLSILFGVLFAERLQSLDRDALPRPVRHGGVHPVRWEKIEIFLRR